MDEVDKFDAAQQQVNVLFQAAQSALLPARDHQVVTESARSLMAFVQEFQRPTTEAAMLVSQCLKKNRDSSPTCPP
jgi:hypothetical protein